MRTPDSRSRREVHEVLRGGVHVHLPERGGDRGEDDEERSAIDVLFERLAGRGKIKVYRRQPDGDEGYVGSLDVTEDLAQNLEERLAAKYGGGTFVLKGAIWDKDEGRHKTPKCATITIDPLVYAPKKSEAEQRREAALVLQSQQQPQQQLDPTLIAERVINMVRMQLPTPPPAAASRSELDSPFVQLLIAQGDRQHEMFMAMMSRQGGGGGGGGGGGDGGGEFSRITSTMDLIDRLRSRDGGGGGGDEGGDNPQRSFGRSLLMRAADRFVDKAADKAGDRVAKVFEEEAKPATSRADAPAATSSSPAMPPKTVPRVPAGAIPIPTREELEKLRRERTAAPAPRASEAMRKA